MKSKAVHQCQTVRATREIVNAKTDKPITQVVDGLLHESQSALASLNSSAGVGTIMTPRALPLGWNGCVWVLLQVGFPTFAPEECITHAADDRMPPPSKEADLLKKNSHAPELQA